MKVAVAEYLLSLNDGQERPFIPPTAVNWMADGIVSAALPETNDLLTLKTATEHLCGALSLWRPVQPPPDPSDCSSGYPEWIRKAWTEVVDALEPIYAEEDA